MKIDWSKYRVLVVLDAVQELRVEQDKLVSVEEPRVKQFNMRHLFVDKGERRITELTLQDGESDEAIIRLIGSKIEEWEKAHRPEEVKFGFGIYSKAESQARGYDLYIYVEGRQGVVVFQANMRPFEDGRILAGLSTHSRNLLPSKRSDYLKSDGCAWVHPGTCYFYSEGSDHATYVFSLLNKHGSDVVKDYLTDMYFDEVYQEDFDSPSTAPTGDTEPLPEQVHGCG